MRALAIALALSASTASARELPAIDPRISSVPTEEDELIRLGTAFDVTQTLLFREGERITSVVLSDPAAFMIDVSATGDVLTLRPLRPSAFGIMSVRTSMRTYEFELLSGSGRIPVIVRLTDPERQELREPQSVPAPASGERFSYRLSGSKTLRPSAISDDGQKTYIEWSGDQAMPATFALGPTGDEQMVDGYMRSGIYVIDRVYDTLIFRIDKDRAKASRLGQGEDHG